MAERKARTHGIVRGMEYVDKSSISDARFGRMFRWLPGETYDLGDLAKLAEKMVQLESADIRNPHSDDVAGPDIVFKEKEEPLDKVYGQPEPGDENPNIPAGYTYFGQFIDHDLTFDPNSSLQKQNDPDATVNFRVPRFDLDSLYGRGPDDQPYLYENEGDGAGAKFLLGVDDSTPPISRPGELNRNRQGRALIGDPRNDENAIVCQLQVVFLNFHNKVFDALKSASPKTGNSELFAVTQRIVRWHYQYLAMTDFLQRVVGKETWQKVFVGSGSVDFPQPNLQIYRPKDGQGYIPIEFSVAAYRFGHSMVRPTYALRPDCAAVGGSPNELFPGDAKKRFHRIPIFSDQHGPNTSLHGFGALPQAWEINWDMFFAKEPMPVKPPLRDGKDIGMIGVREQTEKHRTQPGYRIDTKLVDPLAMLPADVAGGGMPSLGFRNLLRGSTFALPSGENVARAFGLEPLPFDKLWADEIANEPEGTADFSVEFENKFAGRAPLWFYILKEAQQTNGTDKNLKHDKKGGHHLGEVGGHIVAEVFAGLLVNDHQSYIVQFPRWTPAEEIKVSGFQAKLADGSTIGSMYDLINWTTDGLMIFDPTLTPKD